MSNATKPVVVTLIESPTKPGRWHYQANTPDYFKLGPTHARTIRTWATKRAARKSAEREYPRAVIRSDKAGA